MNILGALYAGRQGILRAKESNDIRSGRLVQLAHNPEAQEKLGEDLVGMELDKAQVKASARVIKVSDEIFREISQIGEKK